MARVIGAKAHVARLRRLRSPEMVRKVGSALYAAGQLIQVEAQISITAGAVSGKGHVPSLPGQPPKADTHILANGIETLLVAPLRVNVEAVALTDKGYNYAEIEFGNSRVAERPYLRPAVAKKRAEAVQLVRRAVDSVVRAGG